MSSCCAKTNRSTAERRINFPRGRYQKILFKIASPFYPGPSGHHVPFYLRFSLVMSLPSRTAGKCAICTFRTSEWALRSRLLPKQTARFYNASRSVWRLEKNRRSGKEVGHMLRFTLIATHVLNLVPRRCEVWPEIQQRWQRSHQKEVTRKPSYRAE